MSEIKFSVVMPAYNAAKEIEKSIESVLNQDYTNYEFLIINDASTDETEQIVKKYPQIKLITHEGNKKAGGTRNTGIKEATGDYILFLDSDDFLATIDVLTKLHNIIGEERPDIVYTGFEAIGEAFTGTFLPTEENSVLEKRLVEWNYENVWDVCWNRKFLLEKDIKFVENRFYEDFVFYYKGIMQAKSYKVASFPVHIYYSGRPESMTTNINAKKMQDFYYNMMELFEFCETIAKEYQKFIIEAARRNNSYANRLLDMMKRTIEQ